MLITSAGWNSRAAAQTAPATRPAGPSTQPSGPPIALPGMVAAFYSVNLYAKESGYISELSADIGDHVKRNQVLAIIDDPELELQVKSAQALLTAREKMEAAAQATVKQAEATIEVCKRQLTGMQADHALAKSTLDRQEKLFASHASTDQQMEDVRAKEKVSQAAVDVAAAKIGSAESDLHLAEGNQAVAAAQVTVAAAEARRLEKLVEYTRIKAPFDGVITRRGISPGDLVQSATTTRTTPLFTCQKLDEVRVFCDVPEAGAAGVIPGIAADVQLYGPAGQPGPVFSSWVTRIATSMEPSTRTMTVEIDLKNPNEILRPGMYAQVTLTPKAAAKK